MAGPKQPQYVPRDHTTSVNSGSPAGNRAGGSQKDCQKFVGDGTAVMHEDPLSPLPPERETTAKSPPRSSGGGGSTQRTLQDQLLDNSGQTRGESPQSPGMSLGEMMIPPRGDLSTEEGRMLDKLRVREKYGERARARKVEMYFKALEIANAREIEESRPPVDVTFKINFASHYGQELFVVGSCHELGSWAPEKALKLHWTEGNNWEKRIKIPNGVEIVDYKYLVKKDEEIHWEWGKNHRIYVTALDPSGLVIDAWGAGIV